MGRKINLEWYKLRCGAKFGYVLEIDWAFNGDMLI